MDENENKNEEVKEEKASEEQKQETTEKATENTNSNTSSSSQTSEKAKEAANSIRKWFSANKKLVCGIVILIVLICVIYNCFFNLKGKAKKTINTFMSSMGKGNYKKAIKEIDWLGAYTFDELSKDEYEDFWDNYKDNKDSDEWDDAQDDIEDMEEELKDEEEDFDKDDAVKIKVKKISKFKKVGKNLYEVKAKLEKNEDGDKDTMTQTFYLMKKGNGFKIVGGIGF